jgi:Zn-dependent protease with chaperone function
VDFFGAQDAARGRTLRLVILFALAVASLIALTNLLVLAFVGYFGGYHPYVTADGLPVVAGTFDWERVLLVGAAVAVLVATGSLYKVAVLSRGGKTIVEALGGRLISPDTTDFAHRRLLNVVEEMAIAAGVAVPPVYVLDQETGINAFAAGLTPADAAIGVTRGTLEQLDREQLQGVIGHEMSHIVNGDMRLNVRLAGLLHGILLIGLIGYFLLRGGLSGNRRGRSSKGGGSLPLLVLGGGLMAIGYGGTFFADLIKASVGRQREYLADASSVQFTRNPRGIAGALKRIGGHGQGSRLLHPHAPELSHAYFSQGVRSFLGRLTATHPPLPERIRRLEPGWDGRFDAGEPAPRASAAPIAGFAPAEPPPAAGRVPPAEAAAAAAAAIAHIGRPDDAHLRYAQSLIGHLPAALHWAARESYGARALVYGLLLDRDTEIRRRQLERLEAEGDLGIRMETERLLPVLGTLPREHRLPLLDLAMPALRQLSEPQYRRFEANLRALIRMDRRIDLFEWTLEHLLLGRLAANFEHKTPPPVAHRSCQELPRECALLFTLLAHAAGRDQAGADVAFEAARSAAGMEDLAPLARGDLDHKALDAALDELARLAPRAKRAFLEASAAAILADRRVAPRELEILRAVAAAIDCPMPPILVPEPVGAGA